ncbi:MAG: hypothetical protein ACYS67_00740 [Planctomycetota bacterium]|jgi:hypothetical protein
MSKEKIKEILKPEVVSRCALITGIVTFLSGLLMVPAILWINFYPDAGHEFDFIGMLLIGVAVLSIISIFRLWPLMVIGFLLSIVTLFIERNKYRRFLPFAFFIMGICFYAMYYALSYFCD